MTTPRVTASAHPRDGRPNGSEGTRRPRSSPTWYPAEPILAALDQRLKRDGVGLRTWCAHTSICVRAVQRARERGYVHWSLADKLACSLGTHPAVVWRSWI